MTSHRIPLRVLGLFLILSIGLSACGRVSDSLSNSSFNPFGFLNRDRAPESLMPEEARIQTDRRDLVQSVTRLSLEPTLDGAILRADGLAAGLGYYNASLIPDNDGRPVDGVLTFQFRAAPPFGSEPGIRSERTLMVRTALFLSDFDLAGVRQIVVLGVSNSRSLRP